MRIIWVWVIAISLVFLISLGWYSTMPGIIGVSRALNSTYYEDPNARNVATAIEYVTYAWGPMFCLFILLWAIISSARRDAESEVYG